MSHFNVYLIYIIGDFQLLIFLLNNFLPIKILTLQKFGRKERIYDVKIKK